MILIIVLVILLLVGGFGWGPAYGRSDVLPNSTRKNRVDGSPTDSILVCKRAARHPRSVFSAYGQYLSRSQLRVADCFTSKMRWLRASLLSHVSGVICKRAKKQMIRPDAAPVVAVMEYIQACGNIPKSKPPRDTMSAIRSARSNRNLPIALRVQAGLPFPASFRGSRHVLPETFRQCALAAGYESPSRTTSNVIQGFSPC